MKSHRSHQSNIRLTLRTTTILTTYTNSNNFEQCGFVEIDLVTIVRRQVSLHDEPKIKIQLRGIPSVFHFHTYTLTL